MPLILTTCKTCATGGVPATADFCPTCGRRLGWAETARGRRRAAAVAVMLVALLAVVAVVGLRATRVPAVMPAVVAAHAVPPLAVAPAVPVVPPVPLQPPSPDDPPPTTATVTAPTRPGDTDLTADPLAAYAGGPAADRLTVRGLRLGLPLADVPVALLDDSAPDHLRDTAGNLYAVDDGRISEVHVRDPDLLARWPIDSTNALVGHFGQPTDVYTGDGDEAFPTYLYPARGIHVRWDNAAGRVIEVVLVRPAGGN